MFVDKSLKPLGSILLAGTLVIGGAASASGAPSGPDLEKSIVLLDTSWDGYIFVPPRYDQAGVGFTQEVTADSTCTGWFAGRNGQIMTAGHCVDPADGKKALLQQYLSSKGRSDLLDTAIMNWKVEGTAQGAPVDRAVKAIQPPAVNGAVLTTATTVQIVDFRSFEQGDLALLKASGLSKETPALQIADGTPQVGSQLTSIGFPGSVLNFADPGRIPRPSFKSGTVSSQQVSPQGVSVLEVSTDMSGGMSGGPSVNSNGQVVGINSFGVLNPSTGAEMAGTNFITETKDLRTFLDSHDVPVTQPASKSGFPVLPVVAGVVVAAVVIAGATATLLFRRRRPPVTAPPSAGEATATGRVPPAGLRDDQVGGPETVHAQPMSHPTPVTVGSAEPIPAEGHEPSTSVDPNAERHYCSNCGFEHHPEEKFCPRCGHAAG
ncbi:trypsin-like peptidase domain-containing protein [Nocardia aurantiaca]|uniref:Trypsin-like serine protease n=1 Tax=Nocardia aurantiaca TaxID=2675850 RepID=A0A6I3L4A6_9NOCA|nr:trypsin-like peptidase domain-containing protein [Nocardia aurantiaca]MTE16677.1 trypsin-like serine protease [Nocardia aurantiaca]